MTPARWISVSLIGQYIILAGLFAAERDWARMTYWIGASILATGVLLA